MTSSRRLIPEVDDLADGDVMDAWTLPLQSFVKSVFRPPIYHVYSLIVEDQFLLKL